MAGTVREPSRMKPKRTSSVAVRARCPGRSRNANSYVPATGRSFKYSASGRFSPLGQTPDEMYFKTGDRIPEELEAARQKARQARAEANRKQDCEACELPAASVN
jgi:hypothetical protein